MHPTWYPILWVLCELLCIDDMSYLLSMYGIFWSWFDVIFFFVVTLLANLNHQMIPNYTGSAIGFKLDSLLKLTDTRASNSKMTLMHYLCKVWSLHFVVIVMHINIIFVAHQKSATWAELGCSSMCSGRVDLNDFVDQFTMNQEHMNWTKWIELF